MFGKIGQFYIPNIWSHWRRRRRWRQRKVSNLSQIEYLFVSEKVVEVETSEKV